MKKFSETDPDGSADLHNIETTTTGITDLLNTAVHRIEQKHPALQGCFEGMNFNNTFFRKAPIRDAFWQGVVAQFSGIELSCRDSKKSWDWDDICLLIHDYWFRSAIPEYGYTETPASVIQLETELISPPDGSSIYDPFCTNGTSLVVAAKTARSKKLRLFAETGTKEQALSARLNFLMTDHLDSSVVFSNLVRKPGFVEGPRNLMRFQRIIGTLPSNNDYRCVDVAQDDPYSRFGYGIPPVTQSDFTYLQHAIASLTDDGIMAIAVPPSVLFKQRSEGRIRADIIKDDLVEAVILLPKKVYQFHAFNYAILVINRNKAPERRNKILIIDTSNEMWQGRKIHTTFYPEYLDKLMTAYRDFIDVEGYCRVCTIEEVEKNKFLLDVGRYVKQTRAIVPKVDLRVLLTKLELAHRMQVNEYERVRVKADEIIEYLESMDQAC
ncbi:MAG: N-6 DNA methylase [Methanoregula sp.]|nr:N-6 DNA methylase [Methanoregula sp.]